MSIPGEGSGTRHVFPWDEDLDNPSNFVVDLSTLVTSGAAGPSKTKKAKVAHDKNPDYPPLQYTKYAYEVCVEWYRAQSTKDLEKKYLRHKETGLDILKRDLERWILRKCNESSEYKDVGDTYYNELSNWIDNYLAQIIFNTKKLMETYRPQALKSDGEEKAAEFRAKMEWWQNAIKKHSKATVKSMGWQTDALKAALFQDIGSCLMWISPQAKVVPLSGYDNQGGFAKVRKVRIEGMNKIPQYVEFAGKLSKTTNKRAARIERSAEALVCPLNHPAIIKFLAIYEESMEAYQLWWNGGNLTELLKLSRKVSDTAEWFRIKDVHGYTKPEQRAVSLFRRHKAKLAWALIYVMSIVHNSEVLHNDLSPYNILLHYPPVNDDLINIGICDWGIASRIQEGYASHYGAQTKAQLDQKTNGRWWVAPKLIYLFRPANFETSLEKMQESHKYTVKLDSYAVGQLVASMGIEHMNPHDGDLFKNATSSKYFAMKIRELCDPEVHKRPTCAQVVSQLMDKPWNMKPPEFVWRDHA